MNDTHYHNPLKSEYRESEMKLMIEKLKEKRKGIPAPSRDEMVEMVYNAMKNTKVDNVAAFKSLFLTNALDGSEDWKVSDKINSLIGTELKEFRLIRRWRD